ncbi:MAG: nucleotide exchange factor GrpE [Flavobacteriales bacterium]|nr:nucleotide exchange factor GrpE [Flavobacteriales bacterium]
MTNNSQTKDQSEELENKANTEEPEASKSGEGENTEPEAEEQHSEAEDTQDDPLTKLQAEYDNLNNKYLRLYSEFENFRRRTAKERLETISKAGADVIEEVLPIVDDFDRAIKSNEKSEDPEALKEGFTLIHNKLMRILESQGLKPMDSMGKPFDTEYHEAITNIPAPEEDQKGKVVDVAEKGYFFHDKVLRYAKVVVGQ